MESENKALEEPHKAPEEHQKEDKTYIKSKKKWKDFQLHDDLI